ncbi:MAG: glucose 1-dehydrogenase [Hyphomicrobiaceae bacterium]
MTTLGGKVALISGAARGIGAETARQMANAGAAVVIGDILEDVARGTAAEICAAGGAAEAVRLDVASEGDWTAAIATATRSFGKLDILVNNAGIFTGRDIEEATLDDWHRLVAVNMTGVFLGTKLAAPALRETGEKSPHGSAIVNLASVAGLVGSVGDPLYSMTKGGVTMFTKSAALSFAKKGYRIRVNSVHPGVIDTDMGNVAIARRMRVGGSNDQADFAKQLHPLGRMGHADDVAATILFLASDEARFMTGSALVVDGGFTAQ